MAKFFLVALLFLALCVIVSQAEKSCQSICNRASVSESDCQTVEFNDQVYYAEAYNVLNDTVQLKEALNRIINNNLTSFNFTNRERMKIMKVADEVLGNRRYVTMFYTGEHVLKNATGPDNRGVPWEKEHVWARAYGFKDKETNPHKDLHNLRPCESNVNKNLKANKYFKEGGEEFCILPFNASSNCEVQARSTKNTFEPPDEYKGDSARILFYMELMYGSDPQFNLTLSDTVSRKNKGSTFGYKSHLYNWNFLDEVDERERHRNKVLYCTQKNRNPFIDHPEWIALIYGSQISEEIIDTSTTELDEEDDFVDEDIYDEDVDIDVDIYDANADIEADVDVDVDVDGNKMHKGMGPVGIALIVTIFSIGALFIVVYGYSAYKGTKELDRLPLLRSMFVDQKDVVLHDEENNMGVYQRS